MKSIKKECTRCLKTSRRTMHESWIKYKMCPACYDRTSINSDEQAELEKYYIEVDQAIIYNDANLSPPRLSTPVDQYWNETVNYYLSHNLKI